MLNQMAYKKVVLSDKMISILNNMDISYAKFLLKSFKNGEVVLKHTYIDFSEKSGMITYFNGDIKENSDEYYWNNKRCQMSIGRFIRDYLKNKKYHIYDKGVEEFVNLYKSNQITYKIRIVGGSEIPKWYNSKRYSKREFGSNLHTSCMKDVSYLYFKFYEKNPLVSMLCVFDNTEKLLARALLWKAIMINDDGSEIEVSYLDTIYSSKYSLIQMIRNHCKNNGWYYKDSDYITNGIHTFEKQNMYTIVEDINFFKLPYLDTFSYFGYIHRDGKIIPILSADNKTNFKYHLKSTSGSKYENPFYTRCKDIFNTLIVKDFLKVYNNGYKWYISENNFKNGKFKITLTDGKYDLIILRGMSKYNIFKRFFYKINNGKINNDYINIKSIKWDYITRSSDKFIDKSIGEYVSDLFNVLEFSQDMVSQSELVKTIKNQI